MASLLDMAEYAGRQGTRVAWYLGQRYLGARLRQDTPARPAAPEPGRPRRPVPFAALLAEVAALFARDAANVRAGLYPVPVAEDEAWPERLARTRAFLADIGPAQARRAAGRERSVASLPEARGLPDYYLHEFHFQNGGYLTGESARLYDIQVETLFLGAANAMRRQGLVPIARALAARDQRAMRLVDIGCGTGRFLGQVKQAWPALPALGIDLSHAYLAEAARHLARRRGVDLIRGAGEALPLASASADIATGVFLFHELPGAVRRAVAAEAARVLRPGGLFVLVDSLQTGDRPAWDGMLEGFDRGFHEPYYRDYIGDDLAAAFAEAGLALTAQWTAFLAKVMVFGKG